MDKIYFKIEGYRPGFVDKSKRGISISFLEEPTNEQFLQQYGFALIALFEHEFNLLQHFHGDFKDEDWKRILLDLLSRYKSFKDALEIKE